MTEQQWILEAFKRFEKNGSIDGSALDKAIKAGKFPPNPATIKDITRIPTLPSVVLPQIGAVSSPEPIPLLVPRSHQSKRIPSEYNDDPHPPKPHILSKALRTKRIARRSKRDHQTTWTEMLVGILVVIILWLWNTFK